MTLIQLAQRLTTRYLTPGELNLLPGDAQLALCDAINGATQEFYDRAPPIYRRGTISFNFAAPAAIQNVGVTQNSPQLGGVVFGADQQGCTVFLDGDAQCNEVAGPDALQNAYLGTTGSVQAVVYNDAALFGAGVFASLVGEPKLIRPDSATGRVLVRNEDLRQYHFWGENRRPRIGCPDSYCIAPSSGPGGSAALFVLRVYPLPDIACDVRVDASLQPLQFAPDDLTRSLDLPVPDPLCLNILLPLAANALLDTAGTYWKQDRKPLDPAIVDERIKRLTHDFAVPNHCVGTPPGY